MATMQIHTQVKCHNCQMNNAHGSPYCSRCGAPIPDLPPEQTQPLRLPAGDAEPANEALKRFLHEEQDPLLVSQVYEKTSQIVTGGEEINYIAIANRVVVGLTPDCVVATNKRLLVYKKKVLGKIELDDCYWRDVRDARTSDGRFGVSFTIETIQGWHLTVEALPKSQAWRLLEVTAQYSEKVKDKAAPAEIGHSSILASIPQQEQPVAIEQNTAEPAPRLVPTATQLAPPLATPAPPAPIVAQVPVSAPQPAVQRQQLMYTAPVSPSPLSAQIVAQTVRSPQVGHPISNGSTHVAVPTSNGLHPSPAVEAARPIPKPQLAENKEQPPANGPERHAQMPPQQKPSEQDDPVRKMKQVKEMLDAGLITQEDYEQKKAEILSRI